MSAADDRARLARLLLDVLLDPAATADYVSVTADTLADAVWAAGWRPAADVWDEGLRAAYNEFGYVPDLGMRPANPFTTAAPVVGDAGPPPTTTAAYHAEMQKLREERESLDG